MTLAREVLWESSQHGGVPRGLMNHTPNANMADHSVGARDESHESEVSQALMFCFDNAFPPIFVFLNATARE